MVGHLQALSGNKYFLTAIDWYSCYLGAWPWPLEKADGIAHLILDEIFPCDGCPFKVVSDNGKEMCTAKVVKLFNSLNIHH